MKRILTTACLATIAFLVCGCDSSGISVRDPKGEYTSNFLTQVCNNATTQPAADTRGLRRPAKLAVAQIGEIAPPQAMIRALQERSGAYASVAGIPALTEARDFDRNHTAQEFYQRQLNAYRGLAAQTGADYLLLVGGTADTLEEATPLSALDLTIVGLFVVPSRVIHGEVKAVAVAIDTHTGQPVAVQTAQANGDSLVPAVQVDTERTKLTERLRDQVTVKLAQQLGS